MEATLARHGPIVGELVRLFEARFDPATDTDAASGDSPVRQADLAAITASITAQLDAVPSLDEDRILRSFLTLIEATTRTNAYRPALDGDPTSGSRPVLSFKFDPEKIPDLPLPRPMFEIWVYSPRVEGVHLRGGPVARGGLRWSDRREDFRTEVLGLMKAQMVKNAVIIPIGAKGGFVVKRRERMTDPDDLRREVAACYREFVAGLLDITDNVVDGQVVPPPSVVRHDGDDPYLVVAADKGTATFSDLANDVAISYRFWLGDAFASGGSAGYDHKAMGITARGAWESARSHARALGRNADDDPLTVVGIGDMSGDVFGNGLLRSRFVRLRGGVRPPARLPGPRSAGRSRLRRAEAAVRASSFQLGRLRPRSHLAGRRGVAPVGQVDPALRSGAQGAGHRRQRPDAERAPERHPAARPSTCCGTAGIGTYVKASTETNAEVGDRANDAIRVNGADLRCAMVVEGGNLGLTQRGRVEAALAGVLINTDAIDNSAGVDCSDHEVNIKILLDAQVAAGDLTVKQRNELLASMTDEVAELVLEDNEAQTLALAIARRQAGPMVDVHARYLRSLEAEGLLNRALEFLPTDKQLSERASAGLGLTTPEFAVLLAYTKDTNAAVVLASDLPDDPYVQRELVRYFPSALRERYAEVMGGHRLRREIVTTMLTNEMVNFAGTSFDFRMTDETGAGVADITRAHVVAADVHGLARWWSRIDQLDPTISVDVQFELFLGLRRMVERGVLWLLRHRRPPLELASTVAAFGPGFEELAGGLRGVVHGAMGEAMARAVEARSTTASRGPGRGGGRVAAPAHRLGRGRGGAGQGQEPAGRRRRLLGPVRGARRRLALGPRREAAPVRPVAEPRPGRAARRPHDHPARSDQRRAAGGRRLHAAGRAGGALADGQRAERPARARGLHGDQDRQHVRPHDVVGRTAPAPQPGAGGGCRPLTGGRYGGRHDTDRGRHRRFREPRSLRCGGRSGRPGYGAPPSTPSTRGTTRTWSCRERRCPCTRGPTRRSTSRRSWRRRWPR